MMVLSSAHLAQAASATQPNVLVILADDLGYSDLGCYGGEIPTPNLDRLASQGTRFSQFYNSARCCPSRASLMTGLHPHQTGIGSFATREPREGWSPAYTGHLLPSCVTLAEILGAAGYSTWMVGKWHMGIPGPMERGFQNYFGYRNFLAYSADQWEPGEYVRLPEGAPPELLQTDAMFYATDVFTEYALAFIQAARESKPPPTSHSPSRTSRSTPWFLYLAHSSPHFPVQAPRETIDKYVALYRKGWDALRADRLERMKRLGILPADTPLPPRSLVPVDRDDIANGYPGEPNPAWESLPAERREDLAYRMATYAAMVEHVDRGVGRIIADLKQHGDLDNTLILFLSDNGACYEWGPFGFDGGSRQGKTTLHTGGEVLKIGQPGSHQSYGSAWANLCNTPLKLYKHFCHEGGIASPLIVHWPAALKRSGDWVHDPSHLMDIVPTVCEAVGVPYPDTFEGRTITPVGGRSLLGALQGGSAPKRSLAFEHQGARALRRGDWKVVWGKRMPTDPAWELYDLKTDRCEQRDLARENPGLTRQLAAEWEQWATRVGAEPFQERPVSAPQPAIGVRPTVSTPEVKDCEFSVTCRFKPATDRTTGVLVAQGGREHGFALHLVAGKPAFDVRVNGLVSRITASQPVKGETTVVASLTRKAMTLTVNGKLEGQSVSPGLLTAQPKDPLSVGEDTLSAAGDYDPPNPFDGEILAVDVQSRPVSAEAGRGPTGAIRKPLFADPNYHGSCDPEIVWNPHTQEWWIFYTARRATRESATYVGTPIGVVASADMVNWRFLGYCSFDSVKGQPDMPVTCWAPGIIRDGDSVHMFVTYKDNAEPPWGGKGVIRHYVAPASDLLHGWKLADVPSFAQPDPIDATLIKVGNTFHAYYRVGGNNGIQWATSADLRNWENQGKCPGDVNASAEARGFGYQEAPYVFQFAGWFWMLTDPHKGLAVYRSDDGVTWNLQGRILEEPGAGPQDATFARHPSVAVINDRAFIFYHVEPNRPYPTPPPEQRTVEQKKSFLQVAELQAENGQLKCDRNAQVVPGSLARGPRLTD